MEENKNQSAPNNKTVKKSLTSFVKLKYAEYMSEFKKIVWLSRDELIKQTVIVVVISLMFGVYVAGLDGIFGLAFRQLTQYLG